LPGRWRVRLGYVAGLAALVLARPETTLLVAGFGAALLGECLRLWASGHIEKTVRLATGGPYAHSRNPLYVGSVLMGLGLGLAAGSPWVALATLLYFAAFYPSAIRSEAQFLEGKFGDAYVAWAREVPLFFPRLTPGGPKESRFSWERIRANKEWRTALALPGVALALYLRTRIR
jgi:protein-S-isoprenylcysteine O-methyltransferase Ste14